MSQNKISEELTKFFANKQYFLGHYRKLLTVKRIV